MILRITERTMQAELNHKDLPENPIKLFNDWLQEAMDTIEKDANLLLYLQ